MKALSPKKARDGRLLECVDMIRALLRGEEMAVDHDERLQHQTAVLDRGGR